MERKRDDLLERLRSCGRELPEELEAQILECASPELVDSLVEIMGDDSAVAEHPQKASPPVHAAHLLARLGSEEAIGPLVERVIAEGKITALGEAATHALQAMATESARKQLIEAYEEHDNPETQKRIAQCLAGFPEFRERTTAIVLEQLRRATGRTQSEILRVIGERAGPGALPEVSAWFSEVELSPRRIPDRGVIQTAAETIEKLGGDLTDEQRTLLAATKGRD